MKEKYLWIGLVVIIMSWAGNYFYFQSKQISEPIFLDHYYEINRNPDGNNLTLYYLVSKENPVEVNYVDIDGVSAYPRHNDGFFMWNSNQQQQVSYDQEYRHQYLMSANLSVQDDLINSNEAWSFHEVDVYFTDGSHQKADIGEVILSPYPQNEGVFDFVSASGNSDQEHVSSFRAKKELTIDEISITFEEVQDDIVIKLSKDKVAENNAENNEPDWFQENFPDKWDHLSDVSDLPVSLNADELLRVHMQSNPNMTSYIDLRVKVSGTTSEGERFIEDIPISDYPYLDQKEVDKIIEKKQGGGSI